MSKTTPNSPRKSVQIVETYRQGDRVRQRILRHIGIAEDAEHLQKLKAMATFTLVEMQQTVQGSFFSAEEETQQILAARTATAEAAEPALTVDLKQLRESSRVTTGFHEVYGAIYQQLGFDRLLSPKRQASRRILRDLVMARLAMPASKLASVKHLSRDFGIEMDVNQVYRMMDHLDASVQERLQALAKDAAFSLLGNQVDVMFFDCTTLYFESFDEDQLRQKGFSKDHKTAETQVLLALLVTREGLPIGYRLYPGSTWEGRTLADALQDLRQLCPIERVALVADAGLFCQDNLTRMQDMGQPYIVAARLKNLPKDLQAKLLDPARYQAVSNGESVMETTYLGQRLVVSYSEQRARKDAHDRLRALEKLEKLEKRYHNKTVKTAIKGHEARYLKVEGNGRVMLDTARIEHAARWDGLHGIVTNMQDLPALEVLEQYRGLWQVEETFRLSKHDLRIRPIFHWSASRIQAHIALCFIALSCVRWLMYTCKLRYQALSAEVIRNELAHVQVSILEEQTTQRRFAIPAKPTQHAKALFKLVGKTCSHVPFALSGTEPYAPHPI